MIDIVYKLGNGSKWNDAELRYSLRSLSNFLPLRNVYIVGWKPNWVQNVTFIPLIDAYLSNKDGNLINKMILATTDPDLSDEFVNISDDQIFLQPCTYEDFKQPYIENKHKIKTPGVRDNRWQIRLDRTIAILKERQLSNDCYDTHIPCLLNKKDYARTLFQYEYGFDRGYLGNTLYYNTLQIKGRELESNTLARILEPVERIEGLESMLKGKRFLNYTEKSINQNLFLSLERLFPVKSKYEI